MASNVIATEQKRNETTPKKASIKRVSLKQRKKKILEMRKKSKQMAKDLTGEDEKAVEEFMEFKKLLKKEEKELANQERKARESFHAAASLYPCNGIYDNENYLVVGAVLSFDDAKEKGFAFKSENEFKEFRAWYYEKNKNVLQTDQPDGLLKTFRKVQKAIQKKMEEAEQA